MTGADTFVALLIYTTLQCLQVPLQYTAWRSSKAERENGWGDRERISLFKKRPGGLIEKIP